MSEKDLVEGFKNLNTQLQKVDEKYRGLDARLQDLYKDEVDFAEKFSWQKLMSSDENSIIRISE